MRILLLSAVIVSIAGAAFAFDGKREGLILGAGLGLGLSDYSMDVLYDSFEDLHPTDTEFGLGTIGGRIGGGFNERVLMYLGGLGVSAVDVIVNITGLGMTWYTRDTSPSWYFSGLAGLGTVDPDGLKSHYGFGISAGVGWEFARHWSAEASLGWLRASRDEERNSIDLFDQNTAGLETDAWMFVVTVNGLAY